MACPGKLSRTFGEINRPAELYKKCYELCESLSQDLKNEEIIGKTVTIKLKTVEFKTMTRAQTLCNYTQTTEQIFPAARDLLRVEIQNCAPGPLRLRLMGVRLSNLLNQDQLKQSSIINMMNKVQVKEAVKEAVKEEDVVNTTPDRSIPGLLEKCKPELNSSTASDPPQVPTNYRLPFGAILLDSNKQSRKPETGMHHYPDPSLKVNSADGNIGSEENMIPGDADDKSRLMSQQNEKQAELDNDVDGDDCDGNRLVFPGNVHHTIFDQCDSGSNEGNLPLPIAASTTVTDITCPGTSMSDKVSPPVLLPYSVQTTPSPMSDKVSPPVLLPYSVQTTPFPMSDKVSPPVLLPYSTETLPSLMSDKVSPPVLLPHCWQTKDRSYTETRLLEMVHRPDVGDDTKPRRTSRKSEENFEHTEQYQSPSDSPDILPPSLTPHDAENTGDIDYDRHDAIVDNSSDMILTCPVCDSFRCLDLNQLNAHVDMCLESSPLRQNTTINIESSQESSSLHQTAPRNVGKRLESSPSPQTGACFASPTSTQVTPVPGSFETNRVREWSKSCDKCSNCSEPKETSVDGHDRGSYNPDALTTTVTNSSADSLSTSEAMFSVTDSSACSLATSDALYAGKHNISISGIQSCHEDVDAVHNSSVNESMMQSTPRRASKAGLVSKSTRSPQILSTHTKSPKFTSKAKKVKDTAKVNSDDYTLPDTEGFSCPICDVTIYTEDLNSFNQHVDSCLNRKTIKQILDQQKDDKSYTFGNQPATKRRKVTDNSTRTLYSFFS